MDRVLSILGLESPDGSGVRILEDGRYQNDENLPFLAAAWLETHGYVPDAVGMSHERDEILPALPDSDEDLGAEEEGAEVLVAVGEDEVQAASEVRIFLLVLSILVIIIAVYLGKKNYKSQAILQHHHD